MKKFPVFVISFMLLLLMVGCNDVNNFDSFDTNTPDTNSSSPGINSESTPQGTTETFTYGNLVIEISNVYAVRTESKLAEGIQPYEETIYTCHPGATLTVVNADMSDPTYTEDHKAHAQWGLYDIETDKRTNLTNEMEPIVLDENADGVLHYEGSIFLLAFEYIE